MAAWGCCVPVIAAVNIGNKFTDALYDLLIAAGIIAFLTIAHAVFSYRDLLITKVTKALASNSLSTPHSKQENPTLSSDPKNLSHNTTNSFN